jgi:outer membrane receptor protein involved in Fe transport
VVWPGGLQVRPRWRAGVRYDRLATLSTNLASQLDGLVDTPNYKPWRASAMVDWSLTEFSRLRLQYTYSRALEGMSDNQLFLQYIMSLGPHGAHPF